MNKWELVLHLFSTPNKYNEKTGLAVCCSITSNVKGYPFEVTISGKKINGVVLSDHLKNLDWKIRKARFIEKASKEVLEQCSMKISALIIQA
jgi:mRNA interferase MazF